MKFGIKNENIAWSFPLLSISFDSPPVQLFWHSQLKLRKILYHNEALDPVTMKKWISRLMEIIKK